MRKEFSRVIHLQTAWKPPLKKIYCTIICKSTNLIPSRSMRAVLTLTNTHRYIHTNTYVQTNNLQSMKSAVILAEPRVSISYSWAVQGLMWACSVAVSSASGWHLQGPHAASSPSSSAASPPSKQQDYEGFLKLRRHALKATVKTSGYFNMNVQSVQVLFFTHIAFFPAWFRVV